MTTSEYEKPKKQSKALVTQEDRDKALAIRKERRGGALAENVVRQNALDRLNEAADRWSKYQDPKGEMSENPPHFWFMIFKRKAYAVLKINQTRKPEDLTPQEQNGLAAVFDGIAMVLNESMASLVIRDKIKVRYKDVAEKIGAAHRKLIELEQQGYQDEAAD